MSARRVFALALALTSCTARPAPVNLPRSAPERSPSAAASQPPARVTCPRVERAARMWTGFLVDVPSEAMARALDVVVPIQVALGELFCAQANLDCRPTALLAIDLTDASASEARLRLTLARAGEQRTLPLTLLARAESWQAEADSLAQYLALCRAPAAALNAPARSGP